MIVARSDDSFAQHGATLEAAVLNGLSNDRRVVERSREWDAHRDHDLERNFLVTAES
jgi:hypothetical protein